MNNPPTFTEEQVKEAGRWFNFVNAKATWGKDGGLSSAEAREVGLFFQWVGRHMKLLESHIFEIKGVMNEASPEDKAKQDAEEKARGG